MLMPEDCGVARHDIARIDFSGCRGCPPTTTRPLPWRQNREVAAQVHVREHFDNHVVAAAASKREGFVEMTGRFVVENFVRAFGSDELAAAVRSDRADHAQPRQRARVVRPRFRDASACAVNQHRFAAARARDGKSARNAVE